MAPLPVFALSLAVAAAAAVNAAPPPDLLKFRQDTQALVREGKYPEALGRQMWFHEHAHEIDPGLAGVRLSFALSDWKELGDVYPPARAALVANRDRKTRHLLDTGEDWDGFQEVTAINRVLGQPQKTVELFQRIGERYPELARRAWNVAEDAVLAARRYDLARPYLTDPVEEFRDLRELYQEMKKVERSVPVPLLARLGRNPIEEDFVVRSVQLIQAALALDQRGGAEQVQREALAVIPDRRLREALPSSGGVQEDANDTRMRKVSILFLAAGLLLVTVLGWKKARARNRDV
jgi:hypothetical protein